MRPVDTADLRLVGPRVGRGLPRRSGADLDKRAGRQDGPSVLHGVADGPAAPVASGNAPARELSLQLRLDMARIEADDCLLYDQPREAYAAALAKVAALEAEEAEQIVRSAPRPRPRNSHEEYVILPWGLGFHSAVASRAARTSKQRAAEAARMEAYFARVALEMEANAKLCRKDPREFIRQCRSTTR